MCTRTGPVAVAVVAHGSESRDDHDAKGHTSQGSAHRRVCNVKEGFDVPRCGTIQGA